MLTAAILETRLLEFVREKLIDVESAGGITRDTRLFEERVVDSLRVLELIAFLQSAIGRKIPDAQIVHANFKSIATIARVFSGESAVVQISPASRRTRRTGSWNSPADMLLARGDIAFDSDGSLRMRGPVADLARYFDATVLEWALALGATQEKAPARIPLAALERAGYAEAFPGQLVRMAGIDDEPAASANSWARPPAVCYHAYPRFAECALCAEGSLLTAVGRCYRNEGGRAPQPSLERLAAFTMREIVALGDEDFVETLRTGVMDRVSAWTRDLGLEGSIETATDPFFTSAARASIVMQRMLLLKYELRLRVDAGGRTVAAASFNNHGRHFGRAFGIRLASGETARTGCVAFGWERWVVAFVNQHGIDENRWPDILRATNADVAS